MRCAASVDYIRPVSRIPLKYFSVCLCDLMCWANLKWYCFRASNHFFVFCLCRNIFLLTYVYVWSMWLCVPHMCLSPPHTPLTFNPSLHCSTINAKLAGCPKFVLIWHSNWHPHGSVDTQDSWKTSGAISQRNYNGFIIQSCPSPADKTRDIYL